MSLLTILSLGSAFLNVAQAGHSDDVKHAVFALKELPKSLVEPYCSKLGSSGKGAGEGSYTVTEAQYTITTTLDCSKTGGYGSKPWKTSEPDASHYGYPYASSSADYGGGYSAPSSTYGAEYGQVTSPPYGSEEPSHDSHGGPPGGSSEGYGGESEGSYGGEEGGEGGAPWGSEGSSETDEIITLTSTTTSTYYTTSTVFFFGTVSSTIETTSYITLSPAKHTDGALYEEVGEEDESYGGGEKPWGRYRRAEWCEDKPCRLVQYTDDVIAEACKQYGAEGGYPVGKVTTVTEYGPATETVTPTTCDSTDYPESTEKPKEGYGGHEEGSHEESSAEEGGFKWPSKSTDGAYGSKPEETPYGGEEHGHGKPSGFEGHGKPSGFEGHGKPTGSGEYGSESTSTEESWGAKPTGYGGEEEHGGKPSYGAYSAEEPTSTEKAWGSEPSASGYGGEDHGHGGHGKPSFGGYGHEEPTTSEATEYAASTPTDYGHDEPTTTESAWGAESTPAGYGGEEHGHGKPSDGGWGHGKPSGEWGAEPSGFAKPTGYGGEEHGGKPEHGEHGGKGGKPKMCKVKHPKAKA